MARLHSCLGLFAALVWNASAQAAPLKAVVFDVEVAQSQLEGPSGIPQERLKAASDQLRDLMMKSGDVTLVDLAPEATEISKNLPLNQCRGCDLDIAKKLGADIEVTVALQKTSPVLLGLSGSIRVVKTGVVLSTGFVDIRGNSPEAWAHGVRFLVKERLLEKPLPKSAEELDAAAPK